MNTKHICQLRVNYVRNTKKTRSKRGSVEKFNLLATALILFARAARSISQPPNFDWPPIRAAAAQGRHKTAEYGLEKGTTKAKIIQGITKAKSIQGTTKAKAIQGTTKAKAIQDITKAKSIQGTTKAKVIQGTTKAKAIQDITKAKSIQGSTKAKVIQGTTKAKAIQGTIKAKVIQGIIKAKAHQARAVLPPNNPIDRGCYHSVTVRGLRSRQGFRNPRFLNIELL